MFAELQKRRSAARCGIAPGSSAGSALAIDFLTGRKAHAIIQTQRANLNTLDTVVRERALFSAQWCQRNVETHLLCETWKISTATTDRWVVVSRMLNVDKNAAERRRDE